MELISEGPFENKEDEKQGYYAKKILPLRKRGNWTLCTILFTNVAAASYISIVNDELLGETLALIISIPLIVTFGEIVP